MERLPANVAGDRHRRVTRDRKSFVRAGIAQRRVRAPVPGAEWNNVTHDTPVVAKVIGGAAVSRGRRSHTGHRIGERIAMVAHVSAGNYAA